MSDAERPNTEPPNAAGPHAGGPEAGGPHAGGPHSPHVNAGARALDALPPAEAAAFDRHVAGCEACAVEYAEFVETAALLAAATAQPPPAELREQVLAAAKQTPQLPPVTPGDAGTTEPLAAAESQEAVTHSRQRDDADRRDAPWSRRPAGLLVAAAAIAVLVAGGVLIATQQNDLSPSEAAQQCVAAAADAQVVEPSVGTGGSVTIAPSCDAAVVQLASMPQPPAGKGYQLWVISGDQARSQGMVTTVVADAGDVVVTGLNSADTGIGVSVEPAGGSPAPTTKPVWVVPISS